MLSRIRWENQFKGPFTGRSCNWMNWKSYRASTQEEEKSSICQVERLQWRVQFVGTINRPWNSKQYAWRPTENYRENNPLHPHNLRGLVIGKSGCVKTTVIFDLLLQAGWLNYNHLYVFGKSLHQQEYKVLRKDLEAGLSKQQVSNLFNSQEALGNISPLAAIETFSGVRNGKIRADFCDDCQDIPDPSALDPIQKNLLLLDDRLLGEQNNAEAYYARSSHNNCDTIYIAQNYFRLPRHTIREISNFIILFPQYVKNLTHIHAANDISLLEFKQFYHRVWSKKYNFITIDLTSTNTNEWKVPPEFQPVLFSYWYYTKPLLYSYVSYHGSIQVSHHGSV